MKKTVHIISHSHWDREWYMAFERHRMKLIELVDTAMELFETDRKFKNFHLDGQTIVLDDYLEIKPENRDKVKEFIKNGQFHAGPWYILQDEFFTSGEANVRNLLVGMQEAEAYGALCKIGYFPDAFGNAGQMPQLLKQAGMDAVVFGRGVKPVGLNNELKGGEYESAYSEMFWESPDGSSLLGILFANWYNNGMEIPAEPETAKAFWDEGLAKAERFAGTSQLLFMNGCDHQPVQKDLSEAIAVARRLYPDIRFIHSDFETYVRAVKKELEEQGIDLSHVRGELTSQETDGYWTLVNTASSHADLKMMNRRCETALERRAEPMAVLASLQGMRYPAEFLRYSWKTLMQNHPHDSICGCSVDEVNREMQTRFEKSLQVAEELYKNSAEYLAGQVNTSSIDRADGRQRIPFAVMNPSGYRRSGVVTAVLDRERSGMKDLTAAYNTVKELNGGEFCLRDAGGRQVDARIRDAGAAFGYKLPDNRFRQPYMARQTEVTFEAEDVPAFGYKVYYLEEGTGEPTVSGLIPAERTMENEFIRVEIREDGSFDLTDKKTNRCYRRLGWYEDRGDIGNEYIFVEAKGGQVITTLGSEPEISRKEDEPYRAVYEICHRMEAPVSADQRIEEERSSMKYLFHREAGRSSETTVLTIVTRLILEKSSRGLKIETTIRNTAKDHRLRLMIPTGLRTDTHRADSMFEVVRRNNRHGRFWKNPSGCEHQQCFVSVSDGQSGILAANLGLYEYEILPDEDNTIAVTLLRAVGEMGDWGVFPTPGAQMQGSYTMSCELVPFAAEDEEKAFTEAYQFQCGMTAHQLEIHDGELPAVYGFLTWEGEGLHLTGMKQAENGSDVILRFVNNRESAALLRLYRRDWFSRVYRSNVIEEKLEEIPEKDGYCELELVPFEILTIRLERQCAEN